MDVDTCEYIKYAQYTPLYYACKNGHMDIVLDLLLMSGEPLKQILDQSASLTEGGGFSGLQDMDPAKQHDQVWEAITQIVRMLVMYNADYAACVRHPFKCHTTHAHTHNTYARQ